MKNGVILTTFVALLLAHSTPADACSGIRRESRLPADGESGVPVNTRIFVGGFGPGGVGPYEDPRWIPALHGPGGLVEVDVEFGGDGRAAWALLTPESPLTANTVYSVESSFLAASTFTTGDSADEEAPLPVTSFNLTANAPDRCQPLTSCGWSSALLVERDVRGDASTLIRVYARMVGDNAPELVGVIPENTVGWGLGSATAYNNARAFPLTPGSAASPTSPEDWFGQEWCVRLVAEDLAGNATAMADALEACAVLMDGRPIDCSEEAAGDTSAQTETDVAPATAGTSSGCTTAMAASPTSMLLILLSLFAARSRRRRED